METSTYKELPPLPFSIEAIIAGGRPAHRPPVPEVHAPPAPPPWGLPSLLYSQWLMLHLQQHGPPLYAPPPPPHHGLFVPRPPPPLSPSRSSDLDDDEDLGSPGPSPPPRDDDTSGHGEFLSNV